MIIIKNANVYSPTPLGKKDILISCDKILYISDHIDVPSGNFAKVDVYDAQGKTLIPGIIDLHIHIAGAGGEGGYTTRTPRLVLSDLTTNGITTCVGLLGTDGTTRSIADLIAYAKALEEEGISTLLWTGSYEYPTRTLTGTPRGDIILIDKMIGIGEIAISDHRASHPSEHDLTYLASEARVGGMLSGKCGILHLHLGDGKDGLKPLFSIHKNSEIPFENILPTHINRNARLFEESIEYARIGGYVDITTGIVPDGDDAVHPSEAYKRMLSEGIDPYHITMSSDAGGSMPIFDESGRLVKLGVGSPASDLDVLRECVRLGVPLEKALIPHTSSPARLLKLKNKGNIQEGLDADMILLDSSMNISSVLCKGRFMVKDGQTIVKGSFEK